MSVLFSALDRIDQKEGASSPPWNRTSRHGEKGLTAPDLPKEMFNDFYDLREYVRIANMRGLMRVLSITSSVSGEGASTVSAYLALLMSGAIQKNGVNGTAEKLGDLAKTKGEPSASDKVFAAEFRAFVQDSENDKPAEVESDLSARPKGVLLVDANLHRPRLHEILGISQEVGLAEMLEKQADWRRYVRPFCGSRLKVLTTGVAKQNPTDLLSTDFFRFFIKSVKEEFDYVIIDTPAIMNYVDSLCIASVVDGVVIVIRAGQTRWEIAQSAKRKLLTAHANLLGVALNRNKSSATLN